MAVIKYMVEKNGWKKDRRKLCKKYGWKLVEKV